MYLTTYSVENTYTTKAILSMTRGIFRALELSNCTTREDPSTSLVIKLPPAVHDRVIAYDAVSTVIDSNNVCFFNSEPSVHLFICIMM